MGTIEWEGTAEHVALHPPYILLFDTRFIEVRHLETGRLCQIIPGNDIHCLWDGRGLSTNIVNTGPESWQEGISQEARIHAVMNSPEIVSSSGITGDPLLRRPQRAIAQHVFELLPTVPLYLPGSLASPAAMSYFPQTSQSQQPGHLSPQVSPGSTWR